MKNIDFNAVEKLVNEGYINCQRHPEADLRIYNYSVKAQFEWLWTPETMACRGLIVDGDNRIVARPFEKFFSYDQLNGKVPDEPFEVYEKMDGSLGILYWVNGEPRIATRGSFVSTQAQWATTILRSRYGHIRFDPRLTYLFEIIYRENQVVVDYGGLEDIFLLAIIETETGKELPPVALGCPVVERYDGINDFDHLLSLEASNREGFVVRFQSGLRVKVKFSEYKRLHKLLTGITEQHIWEILSAGQRLEPLLERVPDEYYNWVRETEQQLRAAYHAVEARARAQFQDLGDRKQNAYYYQGCDYPAVMFKMLDGRDYSEIIWKAIKPKGKTVFKCNLEEA